MNAIYCKAVDRELKKMLLEGRVVNVVIIGAAWCQDTHRLIEEVLPKALRRYEAIALRVIYVEAEDVNRKPRAPWALRYFSVSRYPTICVMRGGKVIWRVSEGDRESQRRDLVEMIHWALDALEK